MKARWRSGYRDEAIPGCRESGQNRQCKSEKLEQD